MTQEATNILQEVEGWVNTNLPLAKSNYILKKLEAAYAENELEILSPQLNVGKLDAFKTFQAVLSSLGGSTLRAFIPETVLVNRPSGAFIGTARNMGLVIGTASNLTFTATGTGDIVATGSMLPVVEVGQYLQVRHRINTTGVGATTPMASGPAGQLQAVVDEQSVLPFKTGGTLAFKPGVEWAVMTGDRGAVEFNNVFGQYIVLSDPDALFGSTVEAGDMVRFDAAPETINPAIAGYYKVLDVGINSLALERHAYTRTGEGVYVVDTGTTLPSMTDTVDWTAIRARQDVCYLRHTTQSFAAVRADDVIVSDHTVDDWVLRVEEVAAPGLLILAPTRYTGTNAPYTDPTLVIDEFTATVGYRVTRAVPDKLTTFRFQATAAFDPVFKAGDFVALTERTGGLDPTTRPDDTVNHFKVLSVTNTALHLDNRKYTYDGSVFTATSEFVYANFVDNAGYQGYRLSVDYPYSRDADGSPLLYKVVGTPSGSVQLERKRYSKYDAVTRDLIGTEIVGAIDAFVDHFDVDVVQTYGPRLYLYDPGNAFTSVNAAQDDFVLVSALSGTTRPATVAGSYAITIKPLTGYVFLDAAKVRGRKITDQANVYFAPYERDSSQPVAIESWREPIAYTIKRQDRTAFERLELIAPADDTFADVTVGAYVRVTGLTFTAAGTAQAITQALSGAYVKITGKPNPRTLTLELKRGHTTPAPVAAAQLTVSDLDAATLSSFAATVTGGVFKIATDTDSMRAHGLTISAAVQVGDFAVLGYKVTPEANAATLIAEVVSKTGAQVEFTPKVVSTSGGSYTVTDQALQLNFADANLTTFKVVRLTGAVNRAQDYLDAFQSKLDAGVLSELNTKLNKVFQQPTTQDQATRLTQVLRSGVNRLRDYLGDTGYPMRGFKDGADTGPEPLTVNAVAVLNGFPMGTSDFYAYTPSVVTHEGFQNALAYVIVADLAGMLQPKTVQELKDIYVDAKLMVLGLDAELATRTHPSEQGELRIKRSIEQTRLDSARQVLVSARQRPDLVTSIDQAIATVLPIITTALPSTYATNKHVFFVRDDGVHDFGSAFAGLVATFVTGLKGATAKERRAAFQTFVGVSPEPSLRSSRSGYVRARNKDRLLRRQGQDLANHISQTTHPAQKAALEAEQTLNNQAIAANASPLAEAAQRVQEMGSLLPPPLGNAPAAPSNLQAGQEQEAKEVAAHAPAATPGIKNLVVLPPTPTLVAPESARATSTVTVLANEPRRLAGKIVTNLLSDDRHDYRVTGIVLPYRSMNSRFESATNLSYISMCDFDKQNEGGVQFKLHGIGDQLPDANGRYTYNQFALTELQEQHSEKYQVMDTLMSDEFGSLAMGAKPEVWSISGVLVNDLLSDQLTKFRLLYHEYLRISQCAKNKQKMVITIPALSIKIYGYAVDLILRASADTETMIPFTLPILKTDIAYLPAYNIAKTAARVPLTTFAKFIHGQSGLSSPQPSSRVAAQPGATIGPANFAEQAQSFATAKVEQFTAALNPFSSRLPGA